MLASVHEPDVDPKMESREALMKTGPAIASGEDGMKEMIAEKLVLASKVLDGDVVQWSSREEREDVMVLVERLKHANPEGLVKGKGDQPVNGKEKVERLVGEMLGKMAQGVYHMKAPRKGDLVGHVEMAVNGNKSYFPADERRLVEEIRSILGTGNVQSGPKQKVKN